MRLTTQLLLALSNNYKLVALRGGSIQKQISKLNSLLWPLKIRLMVITFKFLHQM